MQITTADHSDVPWNLQPAIQNAMHRTHRQGIVKTEHPIRLWVELEQLLHCGEAALLGFYITLALWNDVLGLNSHAVF